MRTTELSMAFVGRVESSSMCIKLSAPDVHPCVVGSRENSQLELHRLGMFGVSRCCCCW